MAWNLVMGSKTGPGHEHLGKENQDYCSGWVAGDWAALALADGAGSHELSLQGAELMVHTALDSLREVVDTPEGCTEELLEELVYSLQGLLRSQEDYRQMGCTLALALVGRQKWVVALVGDAFAVVHEGEGQHRLLATPQVHEFANVTELMSSSKINPAIFSGDALEGLSLSSDGLDHLSLQGDQATKGFWEPLVQRAQRGELSVDALLEHLSARELLDDDTTLAMVVRNA